TFASSPTLVPDAAGGLVSGQPLECFAAGPAIMGRMAAVSPSFNGSTADVLTLAEAGNEPARQIVSSAGQALGAVVAALGNVLDPAAVVIGGGLGLAGGLYWEALDRTLREFIWSDVHRHLRLLPAQLGNDSGWIGAALALVP